MGRKRVRLVPRDGTEQFEVRIACYFISDGSTEVAVNVSEPDDTNARPPLHEVLGTLRMAEDILIEHYAGKVE